MYSVRLYMDPLDMWGFVLTALVIFSMPTVSEGR